MSGSGILSMNAVGLIKYGAPLLEYLESAGFSVALVTDFEEVQRREVEMGKNFCHPMFLPSRNDFTKGEAFWLFLEKDQQTVAGLAGKRVDLLNETLESYLRRTSKGQYSRDDELIEFFDPMIGLLRGTMIYVGELNVVAAHQGNIKVLARYTRLMQLLSINHWDFDWMYGFVSDEHVRLNRIYGFSLSVRQAMIWAKPVPQGRSSSHALLASQRRQLEILIRSEAT